MSWINDLCQSVKSKCWCWCQCICCPNGDVRTDNDEPNKSPASSVIERKIKSFYSSLPNTPVLATPSSERKDYFTDASSLPATLHQNDHSHKGKPEIQLVLPSNP